MSGFFTLFKVSNKTKDMEKQIISFGNYQIEISESGNSFFAMAKRMSNRARFGYKIAFNYRFKSAEQRDQYVAKFRSQIELREIEKNNEKEVRAEARRNMINPFKVGDIFYDSWGYDQTNIDFFQVVEVKAKSVVIRAITERMVREAGYLCEYVVAVPDNFIGESVDRRVMIDRGGKYYINGDRGCLFVWDGKEKCQSHYA